VRALRTRLLERGEGDGCEANEMGEANEMNEMNEMGEAKEANKASGAGPTRLTGTDGGPPGWLAFSP
jgi:hypothetical protein